MNASENLPVWARELAVFDTETTGLAVDTSRIVTAHLSVIDEQGRVTRSQDWLLNPGIDIPERATEVHGITTEHAQNHGIDAKEGVYDIVQSLSALLDSGIPIVAYNAAYDFSIVDREARRYDIDPLDSPRPIVDPMIIDKHVDRYRKGRRTLEAASEHYGVVLEEAHTASADALAAGRVAQAIAMRFASQLSMSALELHDAQILWAAEQAASFAKYLESVGKRAYPGDGVWPVR